MRTSAPDGQVAQLVEQGIENPRVGGSIPSLATTRLAVPSLVRVVVLFSVVMTGCGTDSCERLCVEVGQRLDACLEDWPTDWGEVDAANRAAFRRTCQDEWSSVRADLEPRELDDGLDQCDDSSAALSRMARDRTACDELRALYLAEP